MIKSNFITRPVLFGDRIALFGFYNSRPILHHSGWLLIAFDSIWPTSMKSLSDKGFAMMDSSDGSARWRPPKLAKMYDLKRA